MPSRPGADVGADHRPHLRHHEPARCRRSGGRPRPGWRRRRGPGCGSRPRRRRRPRGAAWRSRPAARSSGRGCAPARPGSTSSSKVRIGLIFSVVPIQAPAAPMRPPRRRYSSVSTANHSFRLRPSLLGAEQTTSSAEPPSAAALDRAQHHHRHPAGGGPRVDDVDPLAALAVGDEALARLHGGLVGARDAGRDVDRDDLASLGQQRLIDGEEVADRRLRGGHRLLRGPQALVEAIEVVEQVDLALLFALEPDVEADQVDRRGASAPPAPGRRWCRRQGRVGSRRSQRPFYHAPPMATTLVTGGTGFIGSHVVRQLAARGEQPAPADPRAAATPPTWTASSSSGPTATSPTATRCGPRWTGWTASSTSPARPR